MREETPRFIVTQTETDRDQTKTGPTETKPYHLNPNTLPSACKHFLQALDLSAAMSSAPWDSSWLDQAKAI